MASVDLSDKSRWVLAESAELEGVAPSITVERALLHYWRTKVQKDHPLAPDGLPWPEGYFDTAPKCTHFKRRSQIHGIRPRNYLGGLPVYTTEDTQDPNFKMTIPDESPELEAQWEAEWNEYQKNRKAIAELSDA